MHNKILKKVNTVIELMRFFKRKYNLIIKNVKL